MKFWEKYKIDLIVDSRDRYKKAVLSLLEEQAGAKLLDMGCGDGRFTKKLAYKIGTQVVTGVDMKKTTIEGVRYFQDDLNLGLLQDLTSQEFDVVVASQIIEHLWNTDGFLKELHRVLKPTGYAVISTPNLASWHNILYLLLGKQPETATVSDELYPWKEKPGHRRVFTATELIRLLELHGFVVERIVGTSYYPLMGQLARLACGLDWRHTSNVTVRIRKCRT